MRDVKALYAERKPNGYWFSADTMRYFRSRIGPEFHLRNGSVVFLTSEQPPYGPRAWSVRLSVSPWGYLHRGALLRAFQGPGPHHGPEPGNQGNPYEPRRGDVFPSHGGELKP